MAIIDPDGLFNGDRFRHCSNQARLYWPYFFLASNGYGRIELSYHRIISTAFSTFNPKPTEADFWRFISEYRNANLLFAYKFKGTLWGQWDCPKKLLNKYQTISDRESPAPPEPAFTKWKDDYIAKKSATSEIAEELPKLFENIPEIVPQDLPLGVGVGVGDGVGIGDGVGVAPQGACAPILINNRPDTADDVAQFVREGLGLSGRENTWTITDAVKLSMKSFDLPAMGAAAQIVTAWREYEQADVECRSGPAGFLKDGKFLSKSRWRLRGADGEQKQGKLEQLRALRKANGQDGGELAVFDGGSTTSESKGRRVPETL
jgi:hypothetical protein